MRIPTSMMFEKAYQRFAIGAFNVFTLEQVHGLFMGATKANAPVIVALTKIARNYAQPLMLDSMIRTAEKIYPEVVFAVHLDHGDEIHCQDAIHSQNYNSVMIDASFEPIEENKRITKKIVSLAHQSGVQVEAEVGILSGIEDNEQVQDKLKQYTDPDLACDFVKETGCDSLAVAVGTSHGAYKFTGGGKLQLEILHKIQQQLPSFPLVLHGASAVPQDEVHRINAAGGQLSKKAGGIDTSDLIAAIEMGVCKINIATDARLIWTRVHREFFRDKPDQFDPVISGKTYMETYAEFVANKCKTLGSAGKADEFDNIEK